MNAIVERDSDGNTRLVPRQVQGDDSASLIAVISRAASDPTINIDKLERLMLMHERLQAGKAKMAFDAAMAEMQPTLPVIGRKGKIEIRDKTEQKNIIQSTPYALWEDINESIRPVLAEHGFALSFRTGLADDGRITVTGILSHREGHREETTLTLQHDSTGSKNAVQAVGSSTSYGKRYTACALLNITTRGEDDDGKAGAAPASITDEQAVKLRDIIAALDNPAVEPRLLKALKAESISAIPAEKYETAIDLLNKVPRK